MDIEGLLYLDVSGQWKVLSERMSLESVIRQDPSQIRMIGEEDAVHVPHLALVPVGSGEHRAANEKQSLTFVLFCFLV